jgi:hypothetical protein
MIWKIWLLPKFGNQHICSWLLMKAAIIQMPLFRRCGMRVYYKSYLEFLLKADLLTRELALIPKEATELLAKISGYNNHCTMPVGPECTGTGPSPSPEDLIIRLLALRPDISAKRAREIITRLDLPLPASNPSHASASQQTAATHDSTAPRLH